MKTETALCIFVKAPVPGKVKTRLMPFLTPDRCVALYKALANDVIATAGKTGLDLFVFFHPPGAENKITGWLGKDYRIFAQNGNDLGQRMLHAFETVFEMNYERACIIGSDLPEIRPGILKAAARVLCHASAAIGPSHDGGYYLIGFARDSLARLVFEKIDWGGPKVLEQTLHRLRKAEINPALLPVLHDIDTPGDLVELKRRLEHNSNSAPNTWEVLKSILPAS